MSDSFEHPLARVAERSGATERVYVTSRANGLGCENPNRTEMKCGDPAVAAAAESYFGDSDRLHGDRAPNTVIQHEKTIHRLMIWMHAQGSSVSDIAKHTGVNYSTVANVLRQPWARQRLVQILKETGLDQVKHFLTHEVAPSLEVLREIRDGDIPGRTSDRLSAASAILDRALGKPTVHVESDNTNRTVPADIQRIETDLANTRKQLEDRGQLESNSTGSN